MSVNISLIVLKKMFDIIMIFDDFLWKFSMILADFCYPDPRFIEADPDSADQNETNPKQVMKQT